MHNLLFLVRCLLSLKKQKCYYRFLFAVSAVAAFVLAAAGWAGAEEELLPDGFMLRAGGYRIQNSDTILRLDANNLPVGTYVDFHDTLGGDNQTTIFRLDGLYRFNDKHGLGFSYYSLKFTGSRVLDQDIQWGDVTFPINAKVDSEIKFDVYKLNYQYSLFHNNKVELGASFGLHIMKMSASITAIGIAESQSEAVTAPLPVFGLYADYNFTPRFSAFYTYQWFFVNYKDKIKGGLQDFLIGLEYRVFRNVALGIAYNRFALEVESKGDATTLHVDTSWNGGMLYGAVYF